VQTDEVPGHLHNYALRFARKKLVISRWRAVTVVDSSDCVRTRDQNVRTLCCSHFRRKWRGFGLDESSVVAVVAVAACGRRRRRVGAGRRRVGLRWRRLALSNGADNQAPVGLKSRPQRVWYDLLVQLEFTPVLCSQILLWRLEPTLRPDLKTKLVLWKFAREILRCYIYTRSYATAEGPRDALCQWIRATFHEVRGLERFQTAKVTFKVIQGYWQRCHSIGYIRYLISLSLQLCTASEILSIISQKLKRLMLN